MKWFCAFKAYGDLVIACNNLRKANHSEYGVIAGSHLRPLLDTLQFPGPTKVIEVEDTIPGLFDIRKSGYLRALRSGLALRRGIRQTLDWREDTLVFDRLGCRQQFIASRFCLECLDGGENVYSDYAKFLGFALPTVTSAIPLLKPHCKVYVFPDSRIKAKELPYSLLKKIVELNKRHGKNTTIVKVGAQAEFQPLLGAEVRWVSGFPQLLSTVKEADAVVSADSLPAHLAEYNQLPVFVFTPVPNIYWMPLSSYIGRNYSIFSANEPYETWINTL